VSAIKIHVLNDETINKIAAGEVIDRPAAIVKELLENSLDANATSIELDVLEGGIQEIRVTDNGDGIQKEDLPLAVLPHATSKIRCLEDVYAVKTMGFRGEALSSICHVARVQIISKEKGSEQGYSISAEDGSCSEPVIQAHREGTSIIVQDLFDTIPVRKRVLKRPATEFAEIYRVVQRVSLHHPSIDFVLRHNGEQQLNTVGISDQNRLLTQYFGQDIQDKLLKIDRSLNGLHIKGWVSDPSLTYANRSKQFFSVNSRAVQMGLFHKLASDGYRDVIPYGRHPMVLLDIGVAHDGVDVNIHPKKWDVKFLSPEMLFRTIPKIIKQQFSVASPLPPSPGHPAPGPYKTPWTVFQSPEPQSELPGTMPMFSAESQTELQAKSLEYLQFFDTYIVAKMGDAMWLLDQHAVHERVLYERFKSDAQDSLVVRQPLLVSEVVDLSPDLMALFQQSQAHLKTLHFEVESFGASQIIIREIPALFSGCNVGQLITNFLEDLSAFGKQDLDAISELKSKLEMKACKAAIKAGKVLREEEVKALLDDFFKSPANFTCPHGRPLFVRVTKSDFEKMFHRT